MQSNATPDPLAPRTQEDRSDDGDFLYPWDDWATEHRAQLLLAEALAACAPNEHGEVEADLGALARLETTYNGGTSRMLMDATERFFGENPAYDVIWVQFERKHDVLSIDFVPYFGGRGGWLACEAADNATRDIEEKLLLPTSAACVRYVPSTRSGAASSFTQVHSAPRKVPSSIDPRHTAPLPPGPHEGRCWFDVIVSALIHPEDDPEHGARPLDGLFCVASIALARTLVSLGDQRTAPHHVTRHNDAQGRRTSYQHPPTDRAGWSETRAELGVFISLMRRIHATWSLYLPLVAPAEHAVNCALMPGIVE